MDLHELRHRRLKQQLPLCVGIHNLEGAVSMHRLMRLSESVQATIARQRGTPNGIKK